MNPTGPCRFHAGTAAGYAELLIRSRIDRALARSGRTPDEGRDLRDAGASVVEWVIITALLVGMAAAIGAILLTKVSDKANSINLGLR